MAEIGEILEFWFGRSDEPGYGEQRSAWFVVNPDFDREILERFEEDVHRAISGELDAWTSTPEGSLAMLILMDQFPRNIYRGRPEAFAGATRAVAVSRQAVARGFDQQLSPIQRWFIYLPLEHSEDLEDQREAVRLFGQIEGPMGKSGLEWAEKHFAIVERFGRFPHRNAALGRASTPEEEAFLKEPGSSF